MAEANYLRFKLKVLLFERTWKGPGDWSQKDKVKSTGDKNRQTSISSVEGKFLWCQNGGESGVKNPKRARGFWRGRRFEGQKTESGLKGKT